MICKSPGKATAFVPLVLLMSVAVLLRLFRLSNESLWWDEYASHAFLHAPSLGEFLSLNRTLDPLSLPLYFSLEYLWGCYVSMSVYGLRLMSLAFGVAAIPIVYALGNRLYGRQAGFTAALMLTLSPVHVYHAQSIRMYALFVLLSALMVWSFIELLAQRRLRHWMFHLVVSVLLYWTHPFAGLVSAVLGAYLLVTWRYHKTFFFRWTPVQALLYAPTVAYLSNVRFWPQETTAEWMAIPSLATLVADIFFDDIAGFHWQFQLGTFAQRLGVYRLVLDTGFALLIVGVLLFLGFRIVRARVRYVPPDAEAADADCRAGFNNTSRDLTWHRFRQAPVWLLLLIWVALPPILLFIASHLWRPCMFPRYTVHASLALYLLLGGAVYHVRHKGLQTVIIGLLALCMVLQWVWLQPGPQRTDWQSAARLIRAQAGPNDIVVVEHMLDRDVFVHNALYLAGGPLPIPVAGAQDETLLAEQAALYLGMAARHGATDARATQVWAVCATSFFDPAPAFLFEATLDDWNLSYERWFFPAIRNVYVYVIKASPLASLPQSLNELLVQGYEGAPRDLNHDAIESFGDLAVVLAEHGQRAHALKILDDLQVNSSFARRIYSTLTQSIENGARIEPAVAAIHALWDGYGYRRNARTQHAIAAFREAVAATPDSAIAHFELGIELTLSGHNKEALPVFKQVGALDREYGAMVANLVAALQRGAPVAPYLEAVVHYWHGIQALGTGDLDTAERFVRAALAQDPKLPPAGATLGYILILQGQIDDAHRMLSEFFASTKAPSVCAMLGYALILQGRAEDARAILSECLDATEAPEVRAMLGNALIMGDRLDEGRAMLLVYVAETAHPEASAYGNLALLYLVDNESEQARWYAQKALAADAGFRRQFATFFEALVDDPNPIAAMEEVARLTQAGIQFPPFIIEYLNEALESASPQVSPRE